MSEQKSIKPRLFIDFVCDIIKTMRKFLFSFICVCFVLLTVGWHAPLEGQSVDDFITRVQESLTLNDLSSFYGAFSLDMRGEIQEKIKKRMFNHWEISTGYEESDDIDKQLIRIFDLLKDKIDILNQLRDQYSLEFRFDIVPIVEDDKKPAIYFEHWFIDFIHAINATVDIDLHVYS